MKLKSGRQYKNDLSDIIGILQEHQKNSSPISYNQIVTAVINLYGNWNALDESSISFINEVMNNGNYEDIYSSIKESETRTKSFLLEFNSKYPDVLNNQNVNSVIEQNEKDSQSVIAYLNELSSKEKESEK